MKFKHLYLFLLFFLFSCADGYKTINKDKIVVKKTFFSKGFALIYNDNLYKNKIVKKKINERDFFILHSFLPAKTLVKIYNPSNNKSVIAKVKYKTNFPKIYTAVITKRISDEIELNFNDPYIELVEIKKNETFISKKSETFDEEKNVANKAPVTEININVISADTKSSKIVTKKYIINLGDYYYLESAKTVKNRLTNEGKLNNIKIEKISKNKFRVYAGIFDSFNAMKDTYLIINNFGFEELDVIRTN